MMADRTDVNLDDFRRNDMTWAMLQQSSAGSSAEHLLSFLPSRGQDVAETTMEERLYFLERAVETLSTVQYRTEHLARSARAELQQLVEAEVQRQIPDKMRTLSPEQPRASKKPVIAKFKEAQDRAYQLIAGGVSVGLPAPTKPLSSPREAALEERVQGLELVNEWRKVAQMSHAGDLLDAHIPLQTRHDSATALAVGIGKPDVSYELDHPSISHDGSSANDQHDGAKQNADTRTGSIVSYSNKREQYSFGESVWDCSLFIGTKHLGFGGSSFMFLLLVIHITIQIIYIIIIFEEFTGSVFDAETIAGFNSFRLQTAHDLKYMDIAAHSSLASRICAGDSSVEVGSQQSEALAAINKYLPDEMYSGSNRVFGQLQGQLMCILAVVVWCLVVIQEMRHIVDLVLSISMFMAGQSDVGKTRIVEVAGVWRIEKLRMRRIGIVICVALTRFLIVGFLLIAGLLYLIRTIDLRDLVLNAMALQCVVTIDELLYAALTPSPIRSFMSSLEPIPLPSAWRWKGFDGYAAIGTLGLATVLGVALPVWLFPEVDHLTQARATLCSGKTDFVYARTNAPPFLAWADTLPVVVVGAAPSFTQEVLGGIIKGPVTTSMAGAKAGAIYGSTWSLEAASAMPTSLASGKFNAMCRDILGRPSPLGSGREEEELGGGTLLASDRMGRPVTSCQDLAGFCHLDSPSSSYARMVCPRTCGCHRPDSKLLLTSLVGGCPSTCFRGNYTKILDSWNCTESPKTQLLSHPLWTNYANGIVSISVESKWQRTAQVHLEWISQFMLSEGCGAILSVRNKLGLDLCDERADRSIPFKSLRFMCPITCNCAALQDKTNCPSNCTASA